MTNTSTTFNNTFKTKDLYEGAVLYAKGMKLLTTERVESKCWFVFSQAEECKKISDSYWRQELVLNGKALVDAIRTLKDRIFA